jgi:hypothetical protein
MLQDARKQITSLQAILAETHQHSQEAEKRLHASEKKCAEKDTKMRTMRSEMDLRTSESEERIRRLENNVRVLCQNIENSNSILAMKKSKKYDEEEYDERTIDERHQDILQKTTNIHPEHQFSSKIQYDQAKDTRADMLRKEMETWHVQHQQKQDEEEITTNNNGSCGGSGVENDVEVSDARKRYLLHEEEKNKEQNEMKRDQMDNMYEVGDPYKADLSIGVESSAKKKKKKKKGGGMFGRKTIFG